MFAPVGVTPVQAAAGVGIVPGHLGAAKEGPTDALGRGVHGVDLGAQDAQVAVVLVGQENPVPQRAFGAIQSTLQVRAGDAIHARGWSEASTGQDELENAVALIPVHSQPDLDHGLSGMDADLAEDIA